MTTSAPDFAALRAEFPTTRHWIHLDAARKAPLPRCAEAAMQNFVRDVYAQGGVEAYSVARVEEARAAVARLVGVAPGTLAFVKNTSEGLNIAAQGLGLKPGDNVLLTDLDHENQIYAWRHLEARGVEIRWVPNREGRLPVEAFVERMDRRTRVVAVSYVTYNNGHRVNLPALAEACHARGVLVVVDGIQGLGILGTPLPALGVDILAAGAHKGLLGLNGTGILYCREDLIPAIQPPFAARSSMVPEQATQGELRLAPDAHRFEIGNFNYIGLWVIRRSAEFLAKIGLQHIEERVRTLTTALIGLADRRRLSVRTPRAWEERAGIVSIAIPDVEKTVARLRTQRIIVSAKDGALRVSPHVYNTEEELEKLIQAL